MCFEKSITMRYNPDTFNLQIMKNNHLSVASEAQENKTVHHDMFFVLILNSLLLAAMIGLYFINRSSGAVDNFLGQLVKF